MTILSSPLYDEMDFGDPEYNQDNSYYNKGLMRQQHAQLRSKFYKSYLCSLFISEIAQKLARFSYINYIEELLPVISFKQHELMKQSFNYYKLAEDVH